MTIGRIIKLNGPSEPLVHLAVVHRLGFLIKNDDPEHLKDVALKTLTKFLDSPELLYLPLSSDCYRWWTANSLASLCLPLRDDEASQQRYIDDMNRREATFTKMIHIMMDLLWGRTTVNGPKKNKQLQEARECVMILDIMPVMFPDDQLGVRWDEEGYVMLHMTEAAEIFNYAVEERIKNRSAA